jgi:hypothetical protein
MGREGLEPSTDGLSVAPEAVYRDESGLMERITSKEFG